MRQKEWPSNITNTDDKYMPGETVLSTLVRWRGPPKNSFKAPQKGTDLDSVSSTGYEMLAYPTETSHLHIPTLKSSSSTLSTQPSLQCNYAMTEPDSLGIVGAQEVWVQLRTKNRGQSVKQSFCVGDVHFCEKLGANVSTQALLLAPSTASRTKSQSFLSRMFVWVRKLKQDGNKDIGGTTVVPLSGLTRTTLTSKELTNARRCALHQCEQFWACCFTERVAKNKVATSRFLYTSRKREVIGSDTDTNSESDRRQRHRKGPPPWILEKRNDILKRNRLSPGQALELERKQKFPAESEVRKRQKVAKPKTKPVPTAKTKPVPTAKATAAKSVQKAKERLPANQRGVVVRKARSKLVQKAGLVVRTKTAAAGATTATKAAAAKATAATKAAAAKAAPAKKRAAAAKAANVTARVTAARRASVRRSGSTQLAPNNPQLLAQLAALTEKQQNTEAILQSSLKELHKTMIQFSSSDDPTKAAATNMLAAQLAAGLLDDQAKAAATNMLAAQLAAVQQPRRSPRRSPIQPEDDNSAEFPRHAGRPNSWANMEALYLSQDRNAQVERQVERQASLYQLERERLEPKHYRDEQARASAPAPAPVPVSAPALLCSASHSFVSCACTLPLGAGREFSNATRAGAGAI